MRAPPPAGAINAPHGADTSSAHVLRDERVAVKRCSGCRLRLEVVMGKTFNRKASAHDGIQPFCLRCDREQKGEIWKGHARLLAALGEGHPSRPRWTLDVYVALFEPGIGLGGRAYARGHCHWCGGAVNGWTTGESNSGYWVDRRVNRKLRSGHKDYDPTNAVPCCTPCNIEKGNKDHRAWGKRITPLIEEYGWGRVAWDVELPSFSKAELPDLSRWVVPDVHVQLGLFL